MWEKNETSVDGCLVVTLEETKNAMRLLAEKAASLLRRWRFASGCGVESSWQRTDRRVVSAGTSTFKNFAN
jgi:hypothetical protein